MKRRLFAIFCVLMLTLSGCTEQDADAADVPEAEQPTKQAAIFVPDAQGKYLQGAYITVKANDPLPEQLIAGLINAKALPSDVEIVECQFRFMDGRFELDLNEAFLTALQEGDPTGEALTLYSVVDTFLFNYPTAKSLILTVEGDNIETGRFSYEEPFTELGQLPQ